MEACPSIEFDFNMQFPAEYHDLYNAGVPMVPEGSVYPFYSPAFDGAVMLTPPQSDDCHSSLDDGSESGSVHHDYQANNLFCKTDMGLPIVAQCDLDALSNAGDQPQHTPVKKMKKTNLASLTEEERVVRRRTKNREAAALSRERKRSRLETLEKQVERQKKLNATLVNERDLMKVEAMRLRGEVEYLKSVLSKSLTVAHLFGAPKADPVDPPMSPFMLSVH